MVTGSGENDCEERYAAGTLVTLTATPAENWRLKEWFGNCASSGNNPTCVLEMNEDMIVGAEFVPIPVETFDLNIEVRNDGPNSTSDVRVALRIPPHVLASVSQASAGEFDREQLVWSIDSVTSFSEERLTLSLSSSEKGPFDIYAEIVDLCLEFLYHILIVLLVWEYLQNSPNAFEAMMPEFFGFFFYKCFPEILRTSSCYRRVA